MIILATALHLPICSSAATKRLLNTGLIGFLWLDHNNSAPGFLLYFIKRNFLNGGEHGQTNHLEIIMKL